MSSQTRAQLVRHHAKRGWLLFVPLPGNVSEWPEATWSTSTVPTIAQRTRALAELGFTYADGHEGWDWVEEEQEDDRSRVRLSACASVRPTVRQVSTDE